jgi:hypothetical protein
MAKKTLQLDTVTGNIEATSATSGGPTAYTIDSKTAAYTVVAGDLGKILHCSGGSYTVSLTAAATLGSGFYVDIVNTSNTATHVITIDPNSTETIDGRTTIFLYRGEGARIYCTGTAWEIGERDSKRVISANFTNAYTPPALGDGAVAIGGGYINGAGTFTAMGTCYGGAGNVVILGSSGNGGDKLHTVAIGSGTNAASDYSTAIGRNATAQTSGTAVGNGANAYYTTSATAIGVSANAGGNYGSALGGSSTAAYAGTACGWGSTSGVNGSALGYNSNSAASTGKIAFGNGIFDTAADSQLGIYILRRATTDTTATVLTTDAGAPSTTNLISLPNNGGYALRGLVIGRRKRGDGDEAVMFEFSGLVRRGAAAANTAIVGTITPTQTAADANLAECTLTVTADTTNGGVALTVVGKATTNIRWVATVWATECVYA